ncbi:MAG TPA: hypothetical protein VJ731_13490, partial [Terriglobales bacterium]|nr:hypothetical protein [Terriglobales bacterium]
FYSPHAVRRNAIGHNRGHCENQVLSLALLRCLCYVGQSSSAVERQLEPSSGDECANPGEP